MTALGIGVFLISFSSMINIFQIFAVGVNVHDPIKTNENIIVQLKDTSNINVDYGLDPTEGLGDLVRVG